MKVAFVLDSLGAGGAERSTALLLPALIARGVSPSCLVLRHTVEGSEQEVIALGVPVHLIDGGSVPAKVMHAHRVLKTLEPNIVHTAIYQADQVGRLASVLTTARVISSLVSVPRLRRFRTPADPPRWKVDLVNLLDVATGRLAVDRFHAVTPGVAELYASAYRINPSRITVVERGRPTDELGERTSDRRAQVRGVLNVSDHHRLVITAGRHEHAKAHVDLVRAVSQLHAADGRVRLMIAGRDGNATEDLHRTISETPGADQFVTLLGHRTDVADLLAAADVMALPSLFEGTAGIALEAMAIGTPIVSTRLEGMAGILEHERNSLIVEPRDPVAMAAAIKRVLDDMALAQRLADEARKDFLDRFTLERSADRMVEMYRSVLEGR